MYNIDQAKVEFYKLGFTKVNKFFSDIQVENILKEYDIFLKDEAPLLTGKDINYSDKSAGIINSIHKLALKKGQFFWDLLHSKEMKQFAEIFLSGEAIPRKAEMFAKPAGVGLKSPLHQDNFYWCLRPFEVGNAVTIWIALDETDKSNGGVTYLEKTHTLGIVQHINSNAPGSSQTIGDESYLERYKTATPKLLPGDLVVHDSHIMHFSEANYSGKPRRGLTLQYQSKNAVIDTKMLEHYEFELKNQLRQRGG